MKPCATFLPRDADADHYREHCLLARRDGRHPVSPRTVEQQLVYLEFYPAARPRRGAWPELDAAIEERTPPEPLPVREAGRIIASMMEDPATWGRAFLHCIRAAEREAASYG